MRTKLLLIASAALILALPALAQQVAAPKPGTSAPTPPTPTVPAQNVPASSSPSALPEGGADETAVEEVSNTNTANALVPPSPPVEYPGWARRDPWTVGALDPRNVGIGEAPWGTANGPFLSTLMRRMQGPIASRWAHIALRDALLARARAPVNVHPVDWVAERAWLLLRLGEADAARLLVAGVDVDRFTPKMVQVSIQSALANSDPAALCPLEDGIRKYDPGVRALVQAMCASLAGEPENASAMIDQARRYGRIGGADLALAEKVVGAGANGRAATIEWDPVDSLTAWRFGLATGTGMVPPDRLVNAAPAQLRAFLARAPLLTAQQRLPSAMVAAGLGVFSSQTLVDLYSQIYDSTDAGDLGDSDAWQLRQAYVGKDAETRLAAIRKLLGTGKGGLQQEAARALVARAATFVTPSADLASDAPELISAMLAGGYDEAAARWIPAVNRMDDAASDRCWAMLALAAPNIADVGTGRISSFIRRDTSREKLRSALLVAGLAGLGRISTDTANSLNRRYDLGLGHVTSWTAMIDAAAARGQPGTVLLLTGTGLQTPAFDRVPAAHLYHAVAGLSRTGQGFTARMIAAEALSRT
ncbi:MAG: hypothetical protein QOF05_1002 [Sphingomonadales bacterium]|jgi:hypothetical protein|nr:hypothetical protein [Sphingomonadales bacterium]